MEPDIGSESQLLPTSPAFNASVNGDFRRNIAVTFGTEKLEWCRYPMVNKF